MPRLPQAVSLRGFHGERATTTAKEKLLSSRPAAIAAKNDFVQQYVEGHHDRSAGIGLNSEGDDWAVKVFVETQSAARDIPSRFHDLAVEVQVVGAASTFSR